MMYLSVSSTSGIIKSVFIHVLLIKSALCEIEYNDLNPDGSFAFRHSNGDIGRYYHSVAGNPDNSVRGRYGSRNPSNGRVEETVYTAGPRGFRVNGPQVHRKMDLSQIPRVRIGSADDPLADPYDTPAYSFDIKTQDYNRNEDADDNGRIRGLYSYFDDVGEKHTVRYAAGAGTGFEVLNSVPDSQSATGYSAPLYKAPPSTRGKISIQRGPNGLYKFLATGPDQRRSEVSGPDGVVRGSYSYLDDKGEQRTIEYEAGAGIGYRIIQSSIGRNSHLNTIIPKLPGVDIYPKEYEYLQSSSSGRIRPKDGGIDRRPSRNDASDETLDSRKQSKSSQPDKSHSRGGVRFESTGKNTDSKIHRNDDKLFEEGDDTEDEFYKSPNSNNKKIEPSTNNKSINQSSNRKPSRGGFRFNNYNFNEDLSSIPPIITSNRRILEIGREKDWKSEKKDSTIIKNVCKWFIELPPGQSVRAHVQNIDILPVGGRTLSPSEALRRDELSESSSL